MIYEIKITDQADNDVQLDKYTKYEEQCKIKICQSSLLGLIINKAKIKTQCVQ